MSGEKMASYILTIDEGTQPQEEAIKSFIGGKPQMPHDMELPRCDLCSAEQTFYFQVAFPAGHCWERRTLAVFACTSCAYEDHLIPKMPEGPLEGASLTESFMSSYQVNFRLIAFQTAAGRERAEYIEKIRYKPLIFSSADDFVFWPNKVGGAPNWLLEDEAPATYASTIPLCFLLQLQENFRFDVLPGVASQSVVDLSKPPGSFKPANRTYYELFVGNALYFFGTADIETSIVYVVPQSD